MLSATQQKHLNDKKVCANEVVACCVCRLQVRLHAGFLLCVVCCVLSVCLCVSVSTRACILYHHVSCIFAIRTSAHRCLSVVPFPGARSQVSMRVANEAYLRAHPEVNKLVGAFMAQVMSEHPEDVLAFAADYFTGEAPAEVVAQAAAATAGAGAGSGAARK